MEVLRLHAEHFVRMRGRGYASYINDPEQLKISHCHDYYEIFIVSKGCACHHVNGVQEKISTGMMYFVRPDDVHYYEHPSLSFQIINIIVPQDIMLSLFEYLGEGFSASRLLQPKIPPHIQTSPNELAEIVRELEQLIVSKKIMKDSSDSVFRITLFNMIVKYFPLLPAKNTNSIPDWLRWLSLEMLKKDNFSVGLPAMYRLSGKSVEHLSRSCRKYLNKTPTKLINDIRLEYAARQLITTENPIISICDDVGFISLSHFYHLFKHNYGISPNDFRKDARTKSLGEQGFEDYYLIDADLPNAIPLKSIIN